MPALVAFIIGLIMRLGVTLRMRMAASWPMPTLTPLARALMNRPTGTKLKNIDRKIIPAITIMIVITNSGILISSCVFVYYRLIS